MEHKLHTVNVAEHLQKIEHVQDLIKENQLHFVNELSEIQLVINKINFAEIEQVAFLTTKRFMMNVGEIDID